MRLAGTLRGPLVVADGELQFVTADGPRRLLALGETLWVGRGRSRGFGELRVTELAPPAEPVADRLAAAEGVVGRSGFALTFWSAAVLRDPWLRHLAAPTVAYLREIGLPLPEGTRLAVAYGETRRVRRWNSLAGLPCADERAIAAGSAFWYALPRPATAIPGLVEALERLEREGIGERRAEGFGRVTVADRFHLSFDYGAPEGTGQAMETRR